MISVFLPVEDYYLNYKSKVENSFVNAIAPQKKFVPPPKEIPRLLPLPPPSPPAPIPVDLPAKLPPISQPLLLAILWEAPNLSPKKEDLSPT